MVHLFLSMSLFRKLTWVGQYNIRYVSRHPSVIYLSFHSYHVKYFMRKTEITYATTFYGLGVWKLQQSKYWIKDILIPFVAPFTIFTRSLIVWSKPLAFTSILHTLPTRSHWRLSRPTWEQWRKTIKHQQCNGALTQSRISNISISTGRTCAARRIDTRGRNSTSRWEDRLGR